MSACRSCAILPASTGWWLDRPCLAVPPVDAMGGTVINATGQCYDSPAFSMRCGMFHPVEGVVWHLAATIIVVTVGVAIVAAKLQFPGL